MKTIAIIDYGMGNLHSAAKAVEKVSDGFRVRVTDDAAEIEAADRVIFPGVGAIRDCKKGLIDSGLEETVRHVIANKPTLAICVGMQLLMDTSEENGGVDCLGIIPGNVRLFNENWHVNGSDDKIKVPHMGWNQVLQKGSHPLWRDIAQDSRFYFVHSYYITLAESQYLAGEAEYGQSFCAALTKDNLFAVQFHPEKSQHAGLQLLANFSRWRV